MILKKQEVKYKEYVKNQKELNRLYKLERSRPYKEVAPYQHGWYIVPDLRDDAKNRRDAPLLQKVLDLTMNPFITTNPEFIKVLRQKKDFATVYAEFEVSKFNSTWKGTWNLIRELKYSEWEQLGDPYTKNLFKPYQPNKYNTRMNDKQREEWYYYINIPSYYIVPRVKKRIITRERDVDSKLLSDIKFLRDRQYNLAYEVGRNVDYSRTYPSASIRTLVRGKIAHFKKGEIEDIVHPEKSMDNLNDYYY